MERIINKALNNKPSYDSAVITIEIRPSFAIGIKINVAIDSIVYEGNLEADKESRNTPVTKGQIPISAIDYSELTRDLSISTVIPNETGGLDGQIYTISIVNGMRSKATFTWSTSRPEG